MVRATPSFGAGRELRDLVTDLADRILYLEAREAKRTGQRIDESSKVLLDRARDAGWHMHAHDAEELFVQMFGRERAARALAGG